MLEAISRVSEVEARLILAGPLPYGKSDIAIGQMPGYARACYMGLLPRREICQIYRCARAGLALMHPGPTYTESIPIKLFEYMAVGLPVIVSDFPAWRRLVEKADCGLLVDPLDVHAITPAMEWVLSHPAEAEAMGRRGARVAREQFNWQGELERLQVFYEQVTD